MCNMKIFCKCVFGLHGWTDVCAVKWYMYVHTYMAIAVGNMPIYGYCCGAYANHPEQEEHANVGLQAHEVALGWLPTFGGDMDGVKCEQISLKR